MRAMQPVEAKPADCLHSLRTFMLRERERRIKQASIRPRGAAAVEEVNHQLDMVERLEKVMVKGLV